VDGGRPKFCHVKTPLWLWALPYNPLSVHIIAFDSYYTNMHENLVLFG